MKVRELEGEALDWWVAKATGQKCLMADGEYLVDRLKDHGFFSRFGGPADYSSRWGAGGQIIEDRFIDLRYSSGAWIAECMSLTEFEGEEMRVFRATGRKPLVAAMRAYVMACFGEEVE